MTTSWIAQLPADRLIAEISLWSADLSRMADDMQRIEPYTDIYHIDASDGHFTPAFLMFPDQVAAIRKLTSKPLHVHLMAHESIVLSQIEQFADAGADLQIINDYAASHRVILAADGGIREHTVPDLRSHGADTIVMGSLAFNEADVPSRMQWVHDQASY